MEVKLKSDGRMIFHSSYPSAPKYNSTVSASLSEVITMKGVMEISMFCTKKDSRTLVTTHGGGKDSKYKFNLETKFTAEGITIIGDYNGIPYRSTWTREIPEIQGTFLLEDNKSLVDFFVNQGGDRARTEASLSYVTFRMTEQDGRIVSEEWFGSECVTQTYSLGEEFPMVNSFSSGEEVGVVTSDFPGSYRLVGRNMGSGVVTTWDWVVGRDAITGTGRADNHTATFTYKRVPDIQGKYKLVAQQGVEAQLTALGLSKEEKAKIAPIYLPVYSEIKQMGDGVWKYIAEGDYPEVEFNFHEEYSYTWLGDTYTEVASYTPNMRGIMMVSRKGDKTAVSEMTYTKNFMVLTIEFLDLPNSAITAIYIRL